MYEGCSEEDAGAEMAGKEEKSVRYREFWESARDDGEGARWTICY